MSQRGEEEEEREHRDLGSAKDGLLTILTGLVGSRSMLVILPTIPGQIWAPLVYNLCKREKARELVWPGSGRVGSSLWVREGGRSNRGELVPRPWPCSPLLLPSCLPWPVCLPRWGFLEGHVGSTS